MGGYGSGKCSWRGTKADTDSALRLDLRWLAREGMLAGPGDYRASTLTWSRGGEPFASVGLRHDGRRPDVLTIDYRTRAPGQDWRDVEERIRLDRTDCTYGGDRPWFLCPGCLSRRAVLWCRTESFRCRRCLGLAYTSTRETRHDRMLRKADAVQATMKERGTGRGRIGGLFGGAFDPPPKPKGMHWRTYERRCEELLALHVAALREWERDTELFIARFDRQMARRTAGKA